MASTELHMRPVVPKSDQFYLRKKPDLPKPKSLSDLMGGLRKIFNDDEVDIEAVMDYMQSYASVRKDWEDKTTFDEYRYTRNLLDEGNGKYNLILLCWGEGHKSCIHDHSNSHCFMKVLDGSLTETKYSWPDKEGSPMIPCDFQSADTNDVVYINDSIGLHRIESKPSSKAVSLHLYSPPFDMCQTFDEKSGHKVTCNVTFQSKFNQKVSYKCCKKEGSKQVE